MLKATMQVKREQRTLEAGFLRGNVSNTNLSDTINLDPSSPTHTTYNLDKDLALSPSTKTSKKPDDDVEKSESWYDAPT